MQFNISKLDTVPAKPAGAKSKPKFGPAIRARPKPQAKPVEVVTEGATPDATGKSAAQTQQPQPSEHVARTETAGAEPAAETNKLDNAAPATHEAQDMAAEQVPQPSQAHQLRPAGKRKAPEPNSVFESVPAAIPGSDQAPVPAGPALDSNAQAIVPVAENEGTHPGSGPMTKAKKRKGMGKSAGTAKPTTPLAEQRIDLASMQLGTIVKIANAKDKVKSAAAKAARDAAAAQANSQQTSPAAPSDRQPEVGGGPRVWINPETGRTEIDPNSVRAQAQGPVQYIRREDNDDVLINSMSHMQRETSKRWTPEETEEFYLALGIFGTNFQAVADRLASRMGQHGMVTTNRTRKQVKLKYNKEEKLHPRRIDATVNHQNAMPEDYTELTHNTKASRNEVQDDEALYLEAAPDSAAQDPQRLLAAQNGQNSIQSQPGPSKPAGPTRRGRAGSRATKTALAETGSEGQAAKSTDQNMHCAPVSQEVMMTEEELAAEGVY